MILSDAGIKQALATGTLEIDPTPDASRFTTSAVDLTLGNQFRGWDSSRFAAPGVHVHLDLAKHNYHATAEAYLSPLPLDREGCFLFPPHRQIPMVLLANTRERVNLKRESGLAARVEGKSSLARIGVMVHLTAPTIHCGFSGHITLELINHSPFHIRMVPGVPVCQLVIERLEAAPEGTINTSFQNQREPSGLQ